MAGRQIAKVLSKILQLKINQQQVLSRSALLNTPLVCLRSYIMQTYSKLIPYQLHENLNIACQHVLYEQMVTCMRRTHVSHQIQIARCNIIALLASILLIVLCYGSLFWLRFAFPLDADLPSHVCVRWNIFDQPETLNRFSFAYLPICQSANLPIAYLFICPSVHYLRQFEIRATYENNN
uniref:Uncharacterized protein n=1 Tax=Glossina austeni TaxID=7395 RepID=A0A1A9UXY5_GLOAU